MQYYWPDAASYVGRNERGPNMSEDQSPSIGRPRTFDRERVIATAMDGYWSDGPGAISLNELCRRASVSKPGLYREFGGEDGLMVAALEHYVATVLEPLAGQIDANAPLGDVLAALVDLLTDTTRTGPAGCLLARMQHAPDQLGPLATNRVNALREAARQRYGELIDMAKQRGDVSADVPTTVAAAMIDIQCNALLMRIAAGDDRDMLRSQALLAFSSLTGST